MNASSPIPVNELRRIISLSDYDLDYSDMQESFKGLAKLAAKIAGTELSQINLLDSVTQWTVSSYGLPTDQIPREDSVCQYTIVETKSFEVKNLLADERFRDKPYVKSGHQLRYYFGVPLTTRDGFNVGSLCVLDQVVGKEMDTEKLELLEHIAVEIVNRFGATKLIHDLKSNLVDADQTRRKVAHDIRGPLGGIISLAQLISMQEGKNSMNEVLEFSKLIQQSGNSILELADEILSAGKKSDTPGKNISDHETTLELFKQKLEQLYLPQAINKQIQFSVQVPEKTAQRPFAKNKLLQIVGNLVSNAIKFTPINGEVKVDLRLVPSGKMNEIVIKVSDTGKGMNQETVTHILSGNASSSNGTQGEQGYGFGLALVKHLVDSLQGIMQIESIPGVGTSFEIKISQ
jgi:signal transduction histidine kinase